MTANLTSLEGSTRNNTAKASIEANGFARSASFDTGMAFTFNAVKTLTHAGVRSGAFNGDVLSPDKNAVGILLQGHVH